MPAERPPGGASSDPGDLVQRVRPFEHAVGLLAIPAVAPPCLIDGGELRLLLLHRLDCPRLVVVVNVDGGKHDLTFDPDTASRVSSTIVTGITTSSYPESLAGAGGLWPGVCRGSPGGGQHVASRRARKRMSSRWLGSALASRSYMVQPWWSPCLRFDPTRRRNLKLAALSVGALSVERKGVRSGCSRREHDHVPLQAVARSGPRRVHDRPGRAAASSASAAADACSALRWSGTPDTGAELAHEFVEVGPAGTVETWCWVRSPPPSIRSTSPSPSPRSASTAPTPPWCMRWTRLDPTRWRSVMRVAPRWRAEREGHITDIEAFVPGEALEERVGRSWTPKSR